MILTCLTAYTRFFLLYSLSFLNAAPCLDLGSPEELEAAKIEKLGGTVTKDAAGHAHCIILMMKKKPKLAPFTDEDLVKVDFSLFPELRHVTVEGGSFSKDLTDVSIKKLLAIPSKLVSLTFTYGKTSDDALEKLIRAQDDLFSADFTGTSITDVPLREIGRLASLRTLTLSDTMITDKGLVELSGMDSLFSLDLARTAISDAGLKSVKKMTGLIGVHLNGTNVTNAGILELAALPKLRHLSVSNTKVTESGKKALQKLLPNLKIR
jgi:hypothetical protein